MDTNQELKPLDRATAYALFWAITATFCFITMAGSTIYLNDQNSTLRQQRDQARHELAERTRTAARATLPR